MVSEQTQWLTIACFAAPLFCFIFWRNKHGGIICPVCKKTNRIASITKVEEARVGGGIYAGLDFNWAFDCAQCNTHLKVGKVRFWVFFVFYFALLSVISFILIAAFDDQKTPIMAIIGFFLGFFSFVFLAPYLALFHSKAYSTTGP